MCDQIVILCGGRGTRLGVLTKDSNKTMLRFSNKPQLEYLIKIISSLPVTEILLIAGYQGHEVVNYFQGRIINGVKIKTYVENEPKGTLSALWNARQILKPEFLVINGDTYFEFSDFSFLKKIEESKYEDLNYIFSVRVKNAARYGKIRKASDDLVGLYEKTGRVEHAEVNAGIYLLKKEFIEIVAKNGGTSIETDLMPYLVKKQKIKVLSGYVENFIDIGILSDFNKFPKYIDRFFSRPVIFWDRDNTLNFDTGHTHLAEEMEFCNHLKPRFNSWISKSYINIIVTNQGGIAKGIFQINDLLNFHRKMKRSFLKHNKVINDLYFCPHHPDGKIKEFSKSCDCRKPSTGLLIRAIDDWALHNEKKIFIGDSNNDQLASEEMDIPFFKISCQKTTKEQLEGFYRDNL